MSPQSSSHQPWCGHCGRATTSNETRAHFVSSRMQASILDKHIEGERYRRVIQLLEETTTNGRALRRYDLKALDEQCSDSKRLLIYRLEAL